MLVKCSDCGEMQPWKAKGGPRLALTPCYKCATPALRKLTTEEERARRAAFVAKMPPRAPVAVAAQVEKPPARDIALEVLQIAAPTMQAIGKAAAESAQARAHAATVRALAPVLFAQRMQGQYLDRNEQARAAVDDARALADALAEGSYLD